MGRSSKPSDFSRNVGGPLTSWNITTLAAAWAKYEEVVAADPDDLEQYYFGGLALKMGGEERSDAEFFMFCRAAQAFHRSLPAAVAYYQGIVEDMEAAGETDEVCEDLRNVKGRVRLLTRYRQMKEEDAKFSLRKCTIS